PCRAYMHILLLFYHSAPRRALHSFPTRRSSDLGIACRDDDRRASAARDRRRQLCERDVCRRHAGRNRAIGRTWKRGRCSAAIERDRKSTRLNSSHSQISYAVFCLKKKITNL